IEKFESILITNTQHSLSDNCQYWIGESYWGLGNYQAALAAFKKVFSFEKSNKEDAAQLKIGLCYMRLNDKDKAKQELQRLIDSYPSSEFISSARRFLAQLE
ncbi:tetratricopeptide repeat protein, partial [bacterium]|nr:tetratricopeptide repeat protein [bacterium]